MAKIKTKLTIDAFRATQSMPPSIPGPRIVPIDEGSPIKKSDELPEEPLIPPILELIITQSDQQIISCIYTPIDPIKEKGKGISLGQVSLMKKLSKK